jgi:anti-anti-sigma regulatory factor
MATPAVGSGTGGHAAAAAARAAAPPAAAKGAGRVGTDEYHSATLPSAQEAAVLFSAGNAEAATRLLQAEIKDPAGKGNKQAWLMLFDLFQVIPSREQFDSLSMLFTVKFEQSPPAWVEGDLSTDPRVTPPKERKDIFAFKGGKDMAAEIEKFRTFAEAQGSVRLDVTKLTAISADEATLLAQALLVLRKKNLPIWFTGAETLEKILRDGFNEKPAASTRPYWQLMFELCILLAKSAEFEELALEYAVAFEVSPPNWEVYVNSVSAAVKTSVAKAVAAANPAENGFPLKGLVSVASANQMSELVAYAASRSEVTLDMGKVSRIDFTYTHAFFDMIKAMQVAGKRVILANLSELNAALLEATGVNRYAILVRRKSS